MEAAGRLLHRNWDLYDTRHTVFECRGMAPAELEAGYWRAYRDFYRWGSILRGAWTKPTWIQAGRHAAYAAGWKKFEPLWDALIRARQAAYALPVLESVLEAFGRHGTGEISPRRGTSAAHARRAPRDQPDTARGAAGTLFALPE